MTLENLKTYTLEQATYFVRQGVISQEMFEAYCHAWQTGAPRFAVQACRCAECMKNPVDH